MRLRIAVTLLALLLVCALGSVANATNTLESGTLSTSDGSLVTTGKWASDGVSSISWLVELTDEGYYHYSYTFSVANAPGISHVLLGLSSNLTSLSEITDLTVDGVSWDNLELDTWGPSKSNPDFPSEETLYGMKIDGTGDSSKDLVLNIEFNSYRVPTWQDVYAKGGNESAFYNAGFGDSESLVKISAPDTKVVPEPSSLLALLTGGLGCIGFAIRRRR